MDEKKQSRRNSNTTAKIALVILIACLIVAGVSCLPLRKWTGGKVKDFNLLADILPLSEDSSMVQEGPPSSTLSSSASSSRGSRWRQ